MFHAVVTTNKMGELQPENWFKLSFIFTYVVTFTSALFFHVDWSYSPCYFILAWKTTFRISGRADLLVTNSLNFYLSENVSNLSFISEGCFLGCRIYIGDFFLVWDLGVLAFSLEKAMAPHSSVLARKIPWMEEPGGL